MISKHPIFQCSDWLSEAWVKKVGNDSKVLSNFDFLTFRTSLEKVAGIEKSLDDPAKEERIRELVTLLKHTAVARLFE